MGQELIKLEKTWENFLGWQIFYIHVEGGLSWVYAFFKLIDFIQFSAFYFMDMIPEFLKKENNNLYALVTFSPWQTTHRNN